ncbi:MAG: hypothetical protein MUC90_04020 [Thermoplasmata archaeon]|nr:hypothetical protein [Thermoplasmata archaeon]
MGRFTDALQYQKSNFSSRTYLWFTRIGYAMSFVPLIALVLIQPTASDLLLYLYGFLVSFSLFFSILYVAVVFWNREILAGLCIALLGLSMYIWLVVFVEPESEGNLDELLLIGVYTGWPLSWSVLGTYIYRSRLEQERVLQSTLARKDEVSAAVASMIQARKTADKEPARARAFASGSLLIVTSAGIMLWMVLDIAFHPSEYEMETVLDYAGLLLVAVPQVSALVALWYAWKNQGVKMFMIASMLSAFSLAAPLSVMSEAILWINYRRHNLEWEQKRHAEEFASSLRDVVRNLMLGAVVSFLVVGIILLLSALSDVSAENAEDEFTYGMVSSLLAAGLAAVALALSRARTKQAD